MSDKILMIPGPTQFSSAVLAENGKQTLSHVAPAFIERFGSALEQLRRLSLSKDGQPFVLGGGGTLGWDQVAANLCSPGDKALVINSGYFGDSFGECLEAYGVGVTHLRAPVGDCATPDALRAALKAQSYHLVTVTHVDTSTSVLAPVEAYARVVREVSPSTFLAVDGVCATAGEAVRMDDWGVDVMLTGSQKVLGVPPGLSLLVASQRAMRHALDDARRVQGYYVSWKRWTPIMQAYEARRPSYFSTPPVNLVSALDVALREQLSRPGGVEAQFAAHTRAGDAFKAAVRDMGLKTLPASEQLEAHTMTAIWLPEGVAQADLLAHVSGFGVILAGGLHKDVKAKYFRVGHMGVSVLEPQRGDLEKTLRAIGNSLNELGAKVDVERAVKLFLEKNKL